jgi:hypothetical protein
VGDALSLFAAGVALFALLIASYTGRSTWIALASTALSVAMFVGLLFFATVHEPGQVRARLAWIANELSLVADRQTAHDLESVLEPPALPLPCDPSEGPGCPATTGAETPAATEPAPVQAAATAPGWFDTKPDAKANSQSSVAWSLDDRDVQRPVTSPWGFSIGGTNVSDEALEQVQAVLKPDATMREMPLALSVEGDGAGDGSVIPADAKFSLFSAAPDDAAGQTGGAILSFRYVQAGQRKTSILYLTPAMVARFANR